MSESLPKVLRWIDNASREKNVVVDESFKTALKNLTHGTKREDLKEKDRIFITMVVADRAFSDAHLKKSKRIDENQLQKILHDIMLEYAPDTPLPPTPDAATDLIIRKKSEFMTKFSEGARIMFDEVGR